MPRSTALFVKFISVLSVLAIILALFYAHSFGSVLSISIFLTIIGFIVGDLYVLPKTSNITATIIDFGLAFMVIWITSRAAGYQGKAVEASFFSAIAVSIVEYLFHKALLRSKQVIG
ncbi:DUF2512 family protein [Peribacillus saganii]|uniref:DUF2512 family protein n=1 Tax=Peribacillus saganii TaxID=2303992 RepID=A0A372LQB8_9BACI|nr:DUF2512 family protein [Peribacillus saganii]RFU70405.1 DUF2512 family protein [Peribacillus saganii]